MDYHLDIANRNDDDGNLEISLKYENKGENDFQSYNALSEAKTEFYLTEKTLNISTNTWNEDVKNDFTTTINLNGYKFIKDKNLENNPDIISITKNQIQIKGATNLAVEIKEIKSFLFYIPYIVCTLIVLILIFVIIKNIKKIKEKLKITSSENETDEAVSEPSFDTDLSFKRLFNINNFIDMKNAAKNPIPTIIYVVSFLVLLFISYVFLNSQSSYFLSSITSYFDNGIGEKTISAGILSFGNLKFMIDGHHIYTMGIRSMFLALIPVFALCAYFRYLNIKLSKGEIIYYSILNSLIISLISSLLLKTKIDIVIITTDINITFFNNLFFGFIVNLIILFLFYNAQNRYEHALINIIKNIFKLTLLFSIIITIVFFILNITKISLDNVFLTILMIPNMIFIFMASLCGLIINNTVHGQNIYMIILTALSILSCALVSMYAVDKIRLYYNDPKERIKAKIIFIISTVAILFVFGYLSGISFLPTNELNSLTSITGNDTSHNAKLIIDTSLKSMLTGAILLSVFTFGFDYVYTILPVKQIVSILDKILNFKSCKN